MAEPDFAAEPVGRSRQDVVLGFAEALTRGLLHDAENITEGIDRMYRQVLFAVAQLGARMHYAVPRILHSAGMLDRFYTDICAVQGWVRLLELVPEGLRSDRIKRLLGRHPDGVPRDRITAFTKFGFEYASRRSKAVSAPETQRVHLWAGQTFAKLVVEAGLGHADGVYAFNSAALELLQKAREMNILAVMEQTIAPHDMLMRLLGEEQSRFPGWEEQLIPSESKEFSDRERREWESADLIVCGSNFVVEGIKACRGPIERCVVVPYGVDMALIGRERHSHGGPLRVLTVGEVGLRKGAPYLLAAARAMKGKVVFRMVGSVGVSEPAQAEIRQFVELVGPVPRSEIVAHYRWADVFLFPSICEGSATVIYEALACGLPVICTPNSGSVVRDGKDGFIVPIRNPEAIVDWLERLTDPVRRGEMQRSAISRASEFTVEQYGKRLVSALTKSRCG